MKKIISTLCLSLIGVTSAMAHSSHQSTPHIHVTESLSIEIITVLATVLTVSALFLIKKQLKKNRNHV